MIRRIRTAPLSLSMYIYMAASWVPGRAGVVKPKTVWFTALAEIFQPGRQVCFALSTKLNIEHQLLHRDTHIHIHTRWQTQIGSKFNMNNKVVGTNWYKTPAEYPNKSIFARCAVIFKLTGLIVIFLHPNTISFQS